MTARSWPISKRQFGGKQTVAESHDASYRRHRANITKISKQTRRKTVICIIQKNSVMTYDIWLLTATRRHPLPDCIFDTRED